MLKITVFTLTLLLSFSSTASDLRIIKNPPQGFDRTENLIINHQVQDNEDLKIKKPPQGFAEINPKEEKEILSVDELKEKCYKGHALSCYHAGELLIESDPNIATELFRYGCALQDGFNCFKLAKNYEKGIGIKANLEKAQKLYDKACNLDKTACNKGF